MCNNCKRDTREMQAWYHAAKRFDTENNQFDPEVFDWKTLSYYIAIFCPEHYDPKKFNWDVEPTKKKIMIEYLNLYEKHNNT